MPTIVSSPMRESPHVFVSYRSSHRDLAVRLSQAARNAGLASDTIEEDLGCPFPQGSAGEFTWLTDRISARIRPGSTFIMMATDDAGESRWVLWEGMEGFIKAYRVIVCWLSGVDPLKTVFPLPPAAYRMMHAPQSFIVDARGDPEVAVAAVGRILDPPRRYRVLLRLQQAVTVLLCVAMLLSPVTFLLAVLLLPASAAEVVRSTLMRPWICLLLAAVAQIAGPILYPSYGGPSRLAPGPVDARIRLITPGFTGWKWDKGLVFLALVLVCAMDGIAITSLESMSVIGAATYVKAAILGAVLMWLYASMCWNMFTVHTGIIYRKLEKHLGLNDTLDTGAARVPS